MVRDRTSRFLTQDAEQDAELLRAFHGLEGNPAFGKIVKRITERLEAVDAENRVPGAENKHSEAEAWEAFLATVKKAEQEGIGFTISEKV